ncbi:hypothetical protein [Coleofasciculus sp. FACHB-1120]|uniref:hypothetical protein n=1 Tax=Coleofasciculus sp. FACHB-1120 TaxID=2692783 RepID=UPI001687574E|nr:hypothetical protein [Coleofasciculus sp. FACHB-1120]MBD2740023.1 hypothetical protein [Coleofasciculus sp. FACHB-1120]
MTITATKARDRSYQAMCYESMCDQLICRGCINMAGSSVLPPDAWRTISRRNPV